MVDACKNAGIKHLVFSALDDVKGTLGKSCPDFDGKHEIEKYALASGVPSTSVHYSFYMENFITGVVGPLVTKDDKGTFVFGKS